MDITNCADLLEKHPAETICISLNGSIEYANRSAIALLGIDDLTERQSFFELFLEPPETVSDIINRCAGSNSWQPISVTMASGAHDGLRLALACRGLYDRKLDKVQAVIVSDESRKATFAEHRKLIRNLNIELAEQRRLRIKLDTALKNETRLHQELIHRVKNNLTLLSSLIRSRAGATENEDVVAALEDIHARVKSIGLVHELLDQSEQIDVVDTKTLLEKLCNQMETSICPLGVTINRDLTAYKLHVSEATPLALLVNELVTNSLKHAFNGRAKGQVDIALKRNGVDKIEVHVADDGAGFEASGSGHGSRIIEALAKQLDGELSVKSDEGTSWQLIFAPTNTAHMKVQ